MVRQKGAMHCGEQRERTCIHVSARSQQHLDHPRVAAPHRNVQLRAAVEIRVHCVVCECHDSCVEQSSSCCILKAPSQKVPHCS